MTEPLPAIALTEEEIDQILRSCAGRALLVGGQALAFWAQYYHVKPLGVLSVNVTSDADFVGTAQVARDLSQSLKPLGWRYWQPSVDDATTQTAKLSKRIEGQGIKQVDFLGSIVGLKTEGIQRRAVVLNLANGIRANCVLAGRQLRAELNFLDGALSSQLRVLISQRKGLADLIHCNDDHGEIHRVCAVVRNGDRSGDGGALKRGRYFPLESQGWKRL